MTIHACRPHEYGMRDVGTLFPHATLCGIGHVWVEGRGFQWLENHSGVNVFDKRKCWSVDCQKCLREAAIRCRGTPVDVLELSIRPDNVLWNNNIFTVEYVESMSDGELLRLDNFGKVSLREVRAAIREWRAQMDERELTYADLADAGVLPI